MRMEPGESAAAGSVLRLHVAPITTYIMHCRLISFDLPAAARLGRETTSRGDSSDAIDTVDELLQDKAKTTWSLRTTVDCLARGLG